MGIPCVFEPAVGTANGVNASFETRSEYKRGSVVLFLNGVAKRQDFDDGWVEEGGKKVRLKMAPLLEDDVFFYYRPI